MKYDEARQELRHILKTQKTVRITRLQPIMDSLNATSKTSEVQYLKNEIKKLKKRGI
jgi:hypothetical protein